MQRHRVAVLFVGAAIAAGGLAVACSTGSGTRGFTPDDAGEDATVDTGGEPADSAPGIDAAPDVVGVPDTGGPEAAGGCSPINTACDRVLQNCPSGKECRESTLPDGGTGTDCFPTQAAQHLPKGHSCCPNPAKGPDQCGPGLQCIGLPDDTCAADAGLTGRCSPACCTDDICGADQDGFVGTCTLSIVDQNNTELYKVCDYDRPCKPFHVESCPQGFTCLVEDQFGTARCIPIYAELDGGGSTSTGLPENAPCTSANSCGDGLLCLGPPDGGSTCTWLCLTPSSNPPFDAGALRDAGAGYGGCPSNERCLGQITGPIPSWISFCQ